MHNTVGHLTPAATPSQTYPRSLDRVILAVGGGNSAKSTIGGRAFSVAFGTHACHLCSFSEPGMDLSSWKELKTNFGADANNPNKLFYKYTTNSNTL